MNQIIPCVGYVFLSLAWLLPNHYPPWLSFHSEYLSGVALGLILLGLCIDRQARILVPYSALFTSVLACIPLVQYAFGMIYFSGDAWMACVYLCAFALAQVIGYSTFGEKMEGIHLHYFFIAIAFAASISALLALYQWLQVRGLGAWVVELPPGGRPFANFAQPNLFATLLVMGLVSVFYLFEIDKFGICLLLLLNFLNGFALALTQSRTAIIFCFIFLVWNFAKKKATGFSIGGKKAVAMVAAWVLIWLIIPSLDEALLLTTSATLKERATIGVRTVIWHQACDALLLSPWLGYGWNQVSVGMAQVFDFEGWSRPTEFAHNIFLDLFMWNGLPLGFLIGIGGVRWLTSRALACRSMIGWVLLLMLFFLLGHSQLEYPHSYLFFLIPAGLLIGFIEGDAAAAGFELRLPLVRFLVCIVFFGFLGRVLPEYLLIENSVRNLRFGPEGLDVSAHASSKNIYLLDQLDGYVIGMSTVPHSAMPMAEIDHVDKVSKRFPSLEGSKLNVRVLLANGRYEDARNEMLRIRILYGMTVYVFFKRVLMHEFKDNAVLMELP